MKTTQEHRDIIAEVIKDGKLSTKQMRERLMDLYGLSKSQANDVVKNQRKRLKVWNLPRAIV
jgi:polyhydroxyalkanoate synthesis regulator phasin